MTTRRRRTAPPRTPPVEPGRAPESVFERVAEVITPVAERYAGQPVSAVRPAVRRAWQSAFQAELGEPALSWCAQAIQDRQPWALVHRLRTSGRHRGRPVEPGVSDTPADWRSASIDLPATARAPAVVHLLLRELLTGWGLGSRQLIEDAQLVAASVVDHALDRATPDAPVRFDLVLADGVLRVTVTVGSPPRVRRIAARPARRRHRSSLALLDALASTWGRDTFPGGCRTWFELVAGGQPGGPARDNPYRASCQVTESPR